MRLLPVVTLALLPIASLAAKQGSKSKFDKFLARSQSSAPLKLSDATFEELTAAPRDYSALVIMTALPAQFGCKVCKEFQPEFNILANSWIGGDRNGDSRVLFGTMDFSEGRASFQKVDRGSLSAVPSLQKISDCRSR
jgi:oligosaccharyltransferase complex subunit gamma